MNKLKKRFKEIIAFVLGIIFCACASVLAETCQTALSSSNVTYEDTTVQAETNELITQASNLSARISSLEGRFSSSPETFISGYGNEEWLLIKNSDSGNRGVNISDSNGNSRTYLYYEPATSQSVLRAVEPPGNTPSTLNLRGSSVLINGEQIISPKRYLACGTICNGPNVRGIGCATVVLYGKLAQIDYSYKITTAGTNSSGFNWGLNPTTLKLINANIPTITPITGGTRIAILSSGSIDMTHDGYGGINEANSGYWTPSRVYNDSAAYGKWSETTFATGTVIEGTAYGTY